MAPGHDRNVVYTYRYLRAAMIALLMLLVFSVGYQWWWETEHTCLLGSISAYYYTPARTVFVGSLCALGVCLIAYKGHSSEEDVLLNFSGFMAFVVAIVPTKPDNLCGQNAYSESLPDIASAVGNNIWSLISVTVLATVTAALLRWKSRDTFPRTSRLTIVVSVACVVVLVGELALFMLLRERFIAVAHGLAAVTMVAGIIAVMVFSALRRDRHVVVRGEDNARTSDSWKPEKRYQNTYLVIAGVLGATLVGTLGVAWLTRFDRFILWVELVVIVLFGAYWSVQTRELWHLSEPATAETGAENPPSKQAGTVERTRDEPGLDYPLEHIGEGRGAHPVAE